ncbi:MAG TPA: 3'-5' exonuclease [Candidatus Angelobacter sp.]|nr:3'-5' exonuclease [Candidatus Angelobacter sp.]
MAITRWLSGWFERHGSGVFPATAALNSVRYVVLDTELTSLEPSTNRVISIGAVAMDGNRIRMGQHFYCVVNPGVTVPASTVLVHGLRPADVLEGCAPAEAISSLLNFATGAVLVGHFLGIDLAALRKELDGGSKALSEPAIDTARVQRWLDLRQNKYREDRGHQEEKLDLASLARRYGLEHKEAHHALYDALLTAELWQRLQVRLDAVGVKTLGELLRIGEAKE